MRRLKGIGTPRYVLAGALVALLAALAVGAPAIGASDESTAAAAKKKSKKCKKALWKCTPKRYTLFTTGLVHLRRGFAAFAAEAHPGASSGERRLCALHDRIR